MSRDGTRMIRDHEHRVGRVTSGNGLSKARIARLSDEFRQLTGQTPYPGSLNVLLDRPLHLDQRQAMFLDGGLLMIWPGALNDVLVWLLRWRGAPLHVVEVLSSMHLRSHLGLSDTSTVRVSVDPTRTLPIPLPAKLAWTIAWQGRRDWYYRSRRYGQLSESFCVLFGATQSRGPRDIIAKRLQWNPGMLRIVEKWRRRRPDFRFVRQPLDPHDSPDSNSKRQIINLLSYTKTSGSSYAAVKYPAGYHTIRLGDLTLKGQRDPGSRLAKVPIDFSGKSVLDIGCNQGGMLFAIVDRISWGVGIDFDHRMVNAANRIRAATDASNLSFYVFNLETEPLDLIQDFLPAARVDVVFLLSVCMWIRNWREVIDFAVRVSDAMVFESNGTPEQQADQIGHLRMRYADVVQLTERSDDDPGQTNRQLFHCCKPKQHTSQVDGGSSRTLVKAMPVGD